MTQAILEAIREGTEREALWVLIRDYFRKHGITHIGYIVNSVDVRDPQPIPVRTEGFPDEWVFEYMNKKLYLIDPIAELAQSATTPFLWSKIDELVQLGTEQKAFLIQMRDAGIRDGIAFYVFGPGLRNGLVGLGFDPNTKTPTQSEILDFQLIAQAAHIKYCEFNPIGISPDILSSREREILQWIARGKSNSTIADILSLSPHTVDTMVRRIFTKLDVADRTTAAIQGVGAGLILP